MKVVIAGSRSIQDEQLVFQAIEEAPFEITEVISGGAKGVDWRSLGAKEEHTDSNYETDMDSQRCWPNKKRRHGGSGRRTHCGVRRRKQRNQAYDRYNAQKGKANLHQNLSALE